MRKHWNNPIHKVNTGSTLIRFFIQHAVFCHIMAYICNMHTELISTFIYGKGNGIIKVLGIFSINCNGIHCTKIDTSSLIFFIYLLRYIFQILYNVIRKFYRKIIRLYNRQYICSRIVNMSNNINDLSFRVLTVAAVICDFYDNLMTVHCPH